MLEIIDFDVYNSLHGCWLILEAVLSRN